VLTTVNPACKLLRSLYMIYLRKRRYQRTIETLGGAVFPHQNRHGTVNVTSNETEMYLVGIVVGLSLPIQIFLSAQDAARVQYRSGGGTIDLIEIRQKQWTDLSGFGWEEV
jgi:hypothetical protein